MKLLIAVLIIAAVLFGAHWMSTADARAIKKNMGVQVKKFDVTVDHNQSFADFVRAGHFSEVDPAITPTNFPIEGRGMTKTNMTLVHFGREISGEEAATELRKLNLQPAKLCDLLAFNKHHPDIELFNTPDIIAAGSTWKHPDGKMRIVRSTTGPDRKLQVYWNMGLADDWFLAVEGPRSCDFPEPTPAQK